MIREGTYDEAGHFLVKAKREDYSEAYPAMLGTDILRECDKFLVTEDQGEIVGLACLSIERSRFERVYRLKRCSGRRLGRQLVEQVAKTFLEAQRTSVFCDVTTCAMHKTLKALPKELQEVFDLRLSYLSEGDELEDFNP